MVFFTSNAIEVDALMVEGTATEFLLGEDWMLRNGVKIDFTACEMKRYCNDEKRIMPFSYDGQQDGDAVRVRIVKAAKVTTNTCR